VPHLNGLTPATEPERRFAPAGHVAAFSAQTELLPSPEDHPARPADAATDPAPSRTGTPELDLLPEWIPVVPVDGDGGLLGAAVDFDVYVEPLYPRALRRRGIEGFVELIVRIDGEGRVVDWDIVAFGPDAAFKDEVERVVGQWRFSPPAGAGAGPPPWHRRVRIEFRLQ